MLTRENDQEKELVEPLVLMGFNGIYGGFIGISGGFNGIHHLVGGFSPPLRKICEFVSWDDFPFPTEWKNNKCSKPPTRPLLATINHY